MTTTMNTQEMVMNARVAEILSAQLASLPEQEQEAALRSLEKETPEIVMLPDGRAEIRVEGRPWAWTTVSNLLGDGREPVNLRAQVVDVAEYVAARLGPEFAHLAEAIERDPSTVDFTIENGMVQIHINTDAGREWLCEVAAADLLPKTQDEDWSDDEFTDAWRTAAEMALAAWRDDPMGVGELWNLAPNKQALVWALSRLAKVAMEAGARNPDAVLEGRGGEILSRGLVKLAETQAPDTEKPLSTR